MKVSVFKVGKFYHYRFKVKPFARVQRSTRERDRERAHAVAKRKYDEAIIRSNGGKPIPTLRGLIDLWQETRGPALSKAHRRSLATFAAHHLYDLGDALITQIDSIMVERARVQHLTNRQPATANHWLRNLNLLINWAVSSKIIKERPYAVPMLSVQKKPRSILPTRKTARWLKSIDGYGRRSQGVATGVRMMFGIGLRENEAISADWKWMDWERKTYTPGLTKGKEAVPLPVPSWLLAYLEPMRKAEGLIATRPDGLPLPVGFARRAIRAANAAVGITGITPHRLRGSFATLMSEEHTSPQTVQTMMRHKDIRTTMGYLEVNLDVAAKAMNRIGARISEDGRESGEQDG